MGLNTIAASLLLCACGFLSGCGSGTTTTTTSTTAPSFIHQAICPVSGKTLDITDAATVAVDFQNGQQLYFASGDMAMAYKATPQAFMLSNLEVPMKMPDGAHALPDLYGTTVYCPYTNETIDVSMKSVRVDHRFGQAVYFCCNGCLSKFWTAPETAFWTAPETAFATGDSLLLVGADMDDTVEESWLMSPPPGPSTWGYCPVTGENVTISESTASLTFNEGQKLYFSSQEAVDGYKNDPRAFMLSPWENPLTGLDGKRGLPDMRGSTVNCPYSALAIDVSMQTVRATHRYGQALYFNCHMEFTKFWTDPVTSFPGSGAENMLV